MIGILGGGQLAQMMVERSQKLGLKIRVYNETPDCPANKAGATVCTDLTEFFSGLHFVTIENEFLDLEKIFKSASKTHVHIYPTLDTIELTQNKLNQKFLFQKKNIPTAPFKFFDVQMDQLDDWLKKLELPCVLKWAFGGYDGKGNFVLKNINQINEARAFSQKALDNNTTVYAETFIPFKRELAMVYVRSITQQFIHYPLVITEQENNVCKTVYGPAILFDDLKPLENQAIRVGQKLAEELDFIGAFALEFFETTEGTLIVNEMAPRVHNSGHFTQDTYPADQFENHLRAVLGKDLIEPHTQKFFMMRNLLGPQNWELNLGHDEFLNQVKLPENLYLHWYGKNQLKPGRKMGHINTTFDDRTEVESIKSALMDAEQNIWQTIRNNFGKV